MIRPLSDLVSNLLPSDQDWKIKLLQSWPRIMGALAPKVRLEKIDDESLLLGVFDACWMQELYLLTPMLLANINQNLDRPRIKQLRFKRAGKQTQLRACLQKKLTIVRNERPLTMRETRALDLIGDTQLRDALVGFLQRCAKESV